MADKIGGAAIETAYITSPLGHILLQASGDSLVCCKFCEPPPPPDTITSPVLALAAVQLEQYFAGQLRQFSIPLRLAGSPFRKVVWDALGGVQYGQTTTYGALAAQIGKPAAARAVGTACGKNPVWIIVPCHRVLHRDGGLGGYAGGLERKRELLRLEGAI